MCGDIITKVDIKMPSETKWLTVSQVANLMPISIQSVYRAIRKGDIPSIRIGGRILVPRAALDRLACLEQERGVA